ncbi:MAG: VacJ family lipoprotein [Sulfurovum sp.]|nr:VacJ family lipoprotein [Sulfurovum sp.]
MKSFYFIMLFIFVAGFTQCGANPIDRQNEDRIVFEKENDNIENEFEEFADEFESEEKTSDPFASYNRVMTRFNDGMYECVLKPVGKRYDEAVSLQVKESIRNFFNNIYFPVRFVNNLLQGKFSHTVQETQRFVINSTLGILGFFDPAKSYFKIEAHEEDFGQTLGFYGIKGGPHIVLPLLGPSNLRDTISLYPDALLSPLDYTEQSYPTLTDTWAEFIAAKSLEEINRISLDMDNYEKMKNDAVDLYPYLRDAYEQYRKKQIEE